MSTMHQRAYACKDLDIRSWRTKLVLNYSVDGGKLLKLHVDELKFDDNVDDLHLGVVAQATDDVQDEDDNFAAAASMLKSYSQLKPKKPLNHATSVSTIPTNLCCEQPSEGARKVQELLRRSTQAQEKL